MPRRRGHGRLVVRSFGTLDHPDLQTMIAAFLKAPRRSKLSRRTAAITAACFGVAGPVVDETVKVTNVPWFVDARRVAAALGLARVALLNDLEALAHAVPVLRESETHVLQEGEALRGGNIGLIAAGTGLGQALLHNIDGRFVPSASEAGHADFAARTEREIALTRDLTARYGRADVEHVVSGRGLVNIHRVAHREPCAADVDLESPDAPARSPRRRSSAGAPAAWRRSTCSSRPTARSPATSRCARCPPAACSSAAASRRRLLPVLTTGAFMRAFLAKPPLDRDAVARCR